MYEVEGIGFEGPTMTLRVDGRTYRLDLALVSERLAKAGDTARKSYSISASGYGIHWPELDEDLSVDGLIAAASPKHQLAGRKI
jgi:hypothetical protein